METEAQKEYPVSLKIDQPEKSSRLLALATLFFLIPKAIILIPHIIVMYFLGIVVLIIGMFAQVVVLFTGKYPTGPFKIVKGIMQWQMRINCYFFGLTDKYPPFSLDK